MPGINALELAQYLKTAHLFCLMLEEPWEFDICQIEQSINIPMGELPKRHSELEVDRDTIVICHHGVRSMQVIQYFTAIRLRETYQS